MKGGRGALVGLAGLAGILSTACSVNLNKESGSDFVRNQCTSESDCGKGTCRSGVCVAHEGALSTLLLEVLPPPAAVGVGGVRFLRVETGLELSSDEMKIRLSQATDVHGFVQIKGCDDSVPVQVTLTPREEGYGLPAFRYVAKTTRVGLDSLDPCYGQVKNAGKTIDQFVVSVPVGTNSPVKCSDGTENKACYDVYVEPPPLTPASSGDAGAPMDDCTLVPQLLPNSAVGGCFAINPSKPLSLDVVIPWPESATGALSLDGWTLDVVHPLTGHVLSNRVTLRGDPAIKNGVFAYERRDVRYAPIVDEANRSLSSRTAPGKELVRLTPPTGVVGPVIEAELSGLEATDPTKAVFPEFGPFPAAVPLESWVWESEDSQMPVPGTVELTATKDGERPALDGIKAGIFASFSTTVVVGGDGKLRAQVPPGHYRARAVPTFGSGRAAAESTLDVACDHAPMNPAQCAPADPAHPPTPRAAKVLVVPRAAKIDGQVVSAIDGTPIDQAAVYALPAAFRARECGAGADASTCAATPLGVLDLSLGEDAFVPRPVSGTVGARGLFTLKDVDCGSCAKPSDGGQGQFIGGASFDLSARPPDGSRFPWLIRSGVFVSTDVALGQLTLPLPIVHRGVVQIPQPDSEPLSVPSALIRAYVMRDDTGAVIRSPGGLASCASSSSTGSTGPAARCIRSVLQVAETRAANDGTFELVLPSELQ
jgi:hypothetical protein